MRDILQGMTMFKPENHVSIQHHNGIHTDCDPSSCDWWCSTCNGIGKVPGSRWSGVAARRPGYQRDAVRCPDCKGTGHG